MKGRKKSAALRRLNGCRSCCVWERVAGTGDYRRGENPPPKNPDLAQSLSPVAPTTFCPYGTHEKSQRTRKTKEARPGEPWAIFNKTRTIILIFLGMFSFNSFFFFFPCRRIIHWQKVLGFNFFFSSLSPPVWWQIEKFISMPGGVKLISTYNSCHMETRPQAYKPFLKNWETVDAQSAAPFKYVAVKKKARWQGPIAQSRHELLFHQREDINRGAEPIGQQVPQSLGAYQHPTSFSRSAGCECW